MFRTNSALPIAALLALGGCHVQGSLGASGPTSTSAAPPPAPEQAPAYEQQPPAAGAGVSSSQVGGGPVASAECPTPENHCLDDSIVFAADKGYERGYVYLEPATAQGAPDATGLQTFFTLRDGGEKATKWHYVTRPAARSELAVGQLAVMVHRRKDGMYVAPTTRKEATSNRWWMGRIVSVAPLESADYVVIAGGYKIAADAIRLIEGDDSPALEVRGTEDPHFLREDHWLVSRKPLKKKGYSYVDVAAPIQAPTPQTKNEGQFLSLRQGDSYWTGHAWRTRPATEADLRQGQRVFMVHRRQNGAYVKAKDRPESLTSRWWTGIITDASTAYKGSVVVAGKYEIAVDALRVPM